MFRLPTVSVTHWKDAKAVLRQEYVRQRLSFYEHHVFMFIGPDNIGLAKGSTWRHQRSVIARSFGPATLTRSVEIVTDVAQRAARALLDKIRTTGRPVRFDVETLNKIITIDIFGLVAFSTDLGGANTLQRSPIAAAFEYLGDELMRRIRNPMSLTNYVYSIPTEANRRHKRERTFVRNFLSERIRKRHETPHPINDMLTEMMNSMKTTGSEDAQDLVSSTTLQDILMGLLFAGYDTTSVTLSYALYLVSKDPVVEQHILDEVQSEDFWKNPEKLVYLEGVIYETLRLFPPAIHTSRSVQSPVKLQGDFVMPQGTLTMVPIWLIQRNPEFWPRPLEFHPNRWVQQDSSGNWKPRILSEEEGHGDENADHGIPVANREAFFAFSGGARSCAGRRFAMQECVLILGTLVKSLRFQVADPDYELEPYRNGLIQHPRGGIPMSIEARCS